MLHYGISLFDYRDSVSTFFKAEMWPCHCTVAVARQVHSDGQICEDEDEDKAETVDAAMFRPMSSAFWGPGHHQEPL